MAGNRQWAFEADQRSTHALSVNTPDVAMFELAKESFCNKI